MKAIVAVDLDPALVLHHTLHHTAITLLVQAGINLPTCQMEWISGHKTLAMVERYAHQNGQPFQSAMDKLQQRMKIV